MILKKIKTSVNNRSMVLECMDFHTDRDRDKVDKAPDSTWGVHLGASDSADGMELERSNRAVECRSAERWVLE